MTEWKWQHCQQCGNITTYYEIITFSDRITIFLWSIGPLLISATAFTLCGAKKLNYSNTMSSVKKTCKMWIRLIYYKVQRCSVYNNSLLLFPCSSYCWGQSPYRCLHYYWCPILYTTPCLQCWACILVKVTLYRRLRIGRDGQLNQSEDYDI